MTQEERLLEIERQLELLRDHIHSGIDFKQIDYNDLLNQIVLPSSALSCAKAHLATAQASTGGPTKVLLDTASFTASGITFGSNGFTILTAGKYLITAKVGVGAVPDGKGVRNLIYKNAGLISTSRASMGGANDVYLDNIGLFDLAVDDVIYLYVSHSNDPTSQDLITGEGNTEMSIIKVA